MTQNGEQKKKVFLCYAREDPDSLEHFIELFKRYNPEFELQYDCIPYSGQMHIRFRNFARTCDVALILVNASLINPESYANKHEIPILKKRLRNEHVIVLGVLMQDVNPIKWNQDGEINFFNLTNNKIASSRRSDKYRQFHNSKFAHYKNLTEDGMDTFQKELRESILLLLERHPNITYDPIEIERGAILDNVLLRAKNETDKLLNNMVKDKLLYKIEERLSASEFFWLESGTQPPSEKESYAWWFLHLQKKWYSEIGAYISKKSIEEFDASRPAIEQDLEDRNKLLLSLFKGSACSDCMDQITDFQSNLTIFFSNSMDSNNYEALLTRYQKQVVRSCYSVSKCLQSLSEQAYKITKTN